MTFAFAMGARKRSEEGDEESEQARAGISIMKPRWAQTGIKYDTDKNIFSPLALFSSLCSEVFPVFLVLLSVLLLALRRISNYGSALLCLLGFFVISCVACSVLLCFAFALFHFLWLAHQNNSSMYDSCQTWHTGTHAHTHRLKQSHRYPADLSVLGEVFESVFWDTSIVRFNTYLFFVLRAVWG